MQFESDNTGWDILIIEKLLEGNGQIDSHTGKMYVWLNGIGTVEVNSTLHNVLELLRNKKEANFERGE